MMKAVVLHEYGPPSNLMYEDFDEPVPARGEVLVRVHAASINPVDWKMRSGGDVSGDPGARRCGHGGGDW
jgi:NADPH:quinone reductase-like Zn-dependent oxidoreductase